MRNGTPFKRLTLGDLRRYFIRVSYCIYINHCDMCVWVTRVYETGGGFYLKKYLYSKKNR